MKIGDKVRVDRPYVPQQTDHRYKEWAFRHISTIGIVEYISPRWILVHMLSRHDPNQKLYREAFWRSAVHPIKNKEE